MCSPGTLSPVNVYVCTAQPPHGLGKEVPIQALPSGPLPFPQQHLAQSRVRATLGVTVQWGSESLRGFLEKVVCSVGLKCFLGWWRLPHSRDGGVCVGRQGWLSALPRELALRSAASVCIHPHFQAAWSDSKWAHGVLRSGSPCSLREESAFSDL